MGQDTWCHIKGYTYKREWLRTVVTDEQWLLAQEWLTMEAEKRIEPDYYEGLPINWVPGQAEFEEEVNCLYQDFEAYYMAQRVEAAGLPVALPAAAAAASSSDPTPTQTPREPKRGAN